MRTNVRWLLALALGLGVLWYWLPATAQSPPKLDLNTASQPATAKTVPDGRTTAQADDLARALNDYLMAAQQKGFPTTPETRQKLDRILGELFDLRQQVQQQELKVLEDRLRALKEQIAARAKERDAVIAKQAEALLAGKEPPLPLWVPSTTKIDWATKADSKPKEATTTTPSQNTTTGGPKLGGPSLPPAGQNPTPMARYPIGETQTVEPTIRIGLPDDLIGQLLQTKNDKEKALVAMAIQTRIDLLETQLREAERRLQRLTELAKSGAIDTASVEQAQARMEQLKVLLAAHHKLQRQAAQ